MTTQQPEAPLAPVSTPFRLAELVDEMEGRLIDARDIADRRGDGVPRSASFG